MQIGVVISKALLEGLDPSKNTTILQHTTLNTSRHLYGKSLKMIVKSLNRVKIIVAKGEIEHDEPFLQLP